MSLGRLELDVIKTHLYHLKNVVSKVGGDDRSKIWGDEWARHDTELEKARCNRSYLPSNAWAWRQMDACVSTLRFAGFFSSLF